MKHTYREGEKQRERHAEKQNQTSSKHRIEAVPQAAVGFETTEPEQQTVGEKIGDQQAKVTAGCQPEQEELATQAVVTHGLGREHRHLLAGLVSQSVAVAVTQY